MLNEFFGSAKIAKNTIFLALASVSKSLAGLIGTILIARFLSQDILGQYAFLIGIFLILGTIIEWGLFPLGVQILAKDIKKSASFWLSGIRTVFFLWIIVFVLALAFFRFYKDLVSQESWLLLILGTLLPYSIYRISSSVFHAKQNMGWDLASLLCGDIIRILGIILVVLAKWSLTGLVLTYLVSWIATALYSIYIGYKKIPPIRTGALISNSELLARGLPFLAISLFAMIFFRADVLIIKIMRSDAEAGLYTAAYRIMESCLIFLASFANALFPALANKLDKKEIFHSCKKPLILVIIIALAIWIFISIFSKNIIFTLYGSRFSASAAPLFILFCGFVFAMANTVLGKAIWAAQLQRPFIKIAAVNAIFNIILNIFMIPKWGIIGAATANSLTYFLSFWLHWWLLIKGTRSESSK